MVLFLIHTLSSIQLCSHRVCHCGDGGDGGKIELRYREKHLSLIKVHQQKPREKKEKATHQKTQGLHGTFGKSKHHCG